MKDLYYPWSGEIVCPESTTTDTPMELEMNSGFQGRLKFRIRFNIIQFWKEKLDQIELTQ